MLSLESQMLVINSVFFKMTRFRLSYPVELTNLFVFPLDRLRNVETALNNFFFQPVESHQEHPLVYSVFSYGQAAQQVAMLVS